jgi:hypothetical protein
MGLEGCYICMAQVAKLAQTTSDASVMALCSFYVCVHWVCACGHSHLSEIYCLHTVSTFHFRCLQHLCGRLLASDAATEEADSIGIPSWLLRPALQLY